MRYVLNGIWKLSTPANRYVFIFLLLAFSYGSMFFTDLIGIHVWRQTQTQTVIETLSRNDGDVFSPRVFQIDATGSRVLRMEFSLMQWLFAQGRLLFGSSVLVMRIECFLLSLLTLWGFSRLARQVFPLLPLAGFLGAWCLAFSPLFYYYAINPLPDNFSLCAAVWSLYFLFRFIKTHTLKLWVAHLLLVSLSILTKLPFAIFGAASLVVAWAFVCQPGPVFRKGVLMGSFLLLLLPALWYLTVIPEWHNDGLKGGLFATRTPLAILADIFVHHLISTLPELIVNYASLLAFLAGLWVSGTILIQKRLLRLDQKALLAALVAGLLYVVYELGMIGKEHDYYLFPLVPFILLTVLAGYRQLLQSPLSGTRYRLLRALAIVGLVISPLTAWLRMQSRWDLNEPGFDVDYYRYKEQLRAFLPADAKVITGPDDSHFINLYYLNRTGWTFSESLDTGFIQQQVIRGARYLITDSAHTPHQYLTTHPVRAFGKLLVIALP
ncbi:MAG: glycosyltransferase family 39 protein [Sphingobacteriales bacterium]|nr:MAG: glycosyltransferase family 39 protein [Sphingobacteriales bacterium]